MSDDCLRRLEEFMDSKRDGGFTRSVLPAIECADGFRMSVQASENHYCSPRDAFGPWTHLEVGFPSQVEPLLWPYAESPGEWTDTVYIRVPIELVAAVVELHGGFSGKA